VRPRSFFGARERTNRDSRAVCVGPRVWAAQSPQPRKRQAAGEGREARGRNADGFVVLSCCTPSENRVDGVWFADVARDISRIPGHRLERWVTVAGIKERGTSTMADDVACCAG
jgi:hypothetical protein